MDRGIRITVVGAIVHILPIVARTDNLPIRTLDIPVDSAVINGFPSWIVIFQTDLPAAVVLVVGVYTFIVTVQSSHHRHLNLCFEVYSIGEDDLIGGLSLSLAVDAHGEWNGK